jgi:hypothetical protein
MGWLAGELCPLVFGSLAAGSLAWSGQVPSSQVSEIGIFPDLNPDLAGIPGFGKSGIPIWPKSRIRDIGIPDFAGIGKINPDARASGKILGISGSGTSGLLT